MDDITKSKTRDIIDGFAKEIEQAKRPGPKPAKTVIDFRTEMKDGFERDIYHVPIDLLRYRKDNGRISSDVRSYEKYNGLLDDNSQKAQHTIRDFLKEKDPEKTDELIRSIRHAGQREPAIITCDGFLINGNRRKVVLDILKDEGFTTMKVVILPGKKDPGGPPTLLEIEKIENRYQLQSDGKAEYSNFDKAISIKRKIDLGMSLREQLKDNPIYASCSEKELERYIEEYEDNYLKPLECIDRYLEQLGRSGIYNSIATGIGDREGRWQAFLDYHNNVYKQLSDPRKRLKLGVGEDEAGDIEQIAFKIIRKREFPDLPKVHKIMRDIPKWLVNKESKKELLKLKDIDMRLQREDCLEEDGQECDERKKDKIWGSKHATEIIRQVKKAKDHFEYQKERETPLTLLEAALKKLNHEDMNPMALGTNDYQKAMQLAKDIQKRGHELEAEFFRHEKELKKLKDKHSGK